MLTALQFGVVLGKPIKMFCQGLFQVTANTRALFQVRSRQPDFNRAVTRENRYSGFPTRSDINRSVQSQKMVRSVKFRN